MSHQKSSLIFKITSIRKPMSKEDQASPTSYASIFNISRKFLFFKRPPPHPSLKPFPTASTGFTLYWCSGAHHFKVGGTVTTMEIHPLAPQYGISMPCPIYGNLATSIII
ncbi:hypothetical protein O181_109906 [Austropuccinia psidii MF-1]|uniref:Uncharacterized protein n=1 Tax=Austropuccinia psidii MF-1 TaxID=1389203 RepID=A0A9Q3JY50_9BASI|nr:hypothetical protein [Austropuccinia psidii MF-1]